MRVLLISTLLLLSTGVHAADEILLFNGKDFSGWTFITAATVKLQDAEKPAGEWNSVDVTLNGKNITVVVNGEVVNEGTNLVHLPGRIGLECEFGSVQFRNLRLTPIENRAVAK